ncbi:hypothetical protein BC826DRAFT_1104576 [Russula brevipes]|nr:hypothetical protein BC826DRAFT_1104576 [Russula brevipes]
MVLTPSVTWGGPQGEAAVEMILEALQGGIWDLCQVDHQEEVEEAHCWIQTWLDMLVLEKEEDLKVNPLATFNGNRAKTLQFEVVDDREEEDKKEPLSDAPPAYDSVTALIKKVHALKVADREAFLEDMAGQDFA